MSDLTDAPPSEAPVPAGSVPPQRRAALPTAPLPLRTGPSLQVRVRPLRWALPALAFDGGLRLRIGPLRVGLVRR